MVEKNIFKILAVTVALVGIPIAFALVKAEKQFAHIIFGIILGFAVVGLFIWFYGKKDNKKYKVVSAIIWSVGGLAGFLIGYRLGHDLALPWLWTGRGAAQMYRGSHMDWIAAIIPWMVFALLGATFWIVKAKQQKSGVSNGN